MKQQQFKNAIAPFAAAAVMMWLGACATQTSNLADTDMEGALRSAGFKVRPATTAAQRNQLRNLPDHRFTMVKQGSETYYLYADKSHDRLFAGDHWAHQAYVNNIKNNRLRKQGAFVDEVDPSDRANNKTIVIWHDWAPFPEWQ